MQEAVGLLDSISEFCRRANMAESTFGRRAVNDGKFVARLRDGARITPETLERVSEFLTTQGVEAPASPRELMPLMRVAPGARRPGAEAPAKDAPSRNFRFFDNRQKYLLFVNTCGEKETIARRVGMELAHLHPAPPAVRVFDAGMGDGTVLTRVLREMHRRFPTLPFYAVGKEISLEDARLSPGKDGRPLPRAPRHRPGRHQHVLHRGAVADPQGALRRHLAGVARGGADRHHGGRVLRADRRARAVPGQELAGQALAQDRQSRLRAPGGAGDLSRRFPLPARRRDPQAGRRRAPTTISSSPPSPIAPACRSSSRPPR